MKYCLGKIVFQKHNISFICSAITFSLQAEKAKEKEKV